MRGLVVGISLASVAFLVNRVMPSWAASWRFAASGVGIVAATALFCLYKYQNSLIYQPKIAGYTTPKDNPQYFRSPSEHNMIYESVKILTSDRVSLSAWLITQPGLSNKLPTILFFHANAGNMGFRLPNLADLHNFVKCNILIVSYRGYGDSDKAPITEQGLKLDADATLQYLATRSDVVDPNQIVVFGRSLGGAVAIYIAEKFPEMIKAVIVENTFTSLPELVDHIFPILSPLRPMLLCNFWLSIEEIAKIKCPILFISGDMDELVPKEQMQQLFEAAKQSKQKKFHVVLKGTHNNCPQIGGESYYTVIHDFVQNHASGEFYSI